MQAIKGLFCFLLLLTCVTMNSMNWRCCVCFWLKQTQKKSSNACKKQSLREPFHDGAQELERVPRSELKVPISVIPRNNSDLSLVIVSAVVSEKERDATNGTPWTKGQFFSDTKPKYEPFQDQESRTPIPRAETIQENLDSAGILKAPSNSFIDPTWDRVDSVSSKNSLVDKIVHSSETFRHCDSSDFLEALVDQETQTERKKVSFR